MLVIFFGRIQKEKQIGSDMSYLTHTNVLQGKKTVVCVVVFFRIFSYKIEIFGRTHKGSGLQTLSRKVFKTIQ